MAKPKKAAEVIETAQEDGVNTAEGAKNYLYDLREDVIESLGNLAEQEQAADNGAKFTPHIIVAFKFFSAALIEWIYPSNG